MKRLLPFSGLVLLFLLTFLACKKEQSRDQNEEVLLEQRQNFFQLDSTECGAPVQKNLWDEAMVEDRGDLTISNNDSNIIIKYASNGINNVTVQKIHVLFGSRDHVRERITETNLWSPCDGPAQPDRTKISAAGSLWDSIQIDNSNFQSDGCIFIGIWVTLVNEAGFQWCTFPVPFDESINGISAWKSYLKYCRQSCDTAVVCGELRTHTPGGWGSKPHGNNPGTYLHENFADAFPDGLAIGCAPNNFFVRFTTAQAITDYLPAGGEPKSLKKNYTNPKTRDLKNSFVHHLVALTLNVGFDLFDEDFGESGVKLGDMIINKGKFKGWTVNEFLAEANKVLGGCSTRYSAKKMIETLADINEFSKCGDRDHNGPNGSNDGGDDDHDDDDDDDDHDGDHGCDCDFLVCPQER